MSFLIGSLSNEAAHHWVNAIKPEELPASLKNFEQSIMEKEIELQRTQKYLLADSTSFSLRIHVTELTKEIGSLNKLIVLIESKLRAIICF